MLLAAFSLGALAAIASLVRLAHRHAPASGAGAGRGGPP